MIAIIDYGVGNLFSLCSSFDRIGVDSVVTSDADTIRRADKLILPGVGAFGDAIAKLSASGLDRVLTEQAEQGKPIMGICLGMQLLFEESLEYGRHKGLGLLKGTVIPMADQLPPKLKVPHIGWNALEITRPSTLLRELRSGEFVYFVHSFYATGCEDSLIARTEYAIPLTAAVEKGNIMGCQFHPEKSGETGMRILKAFAEMEAVV